MTDDKMHEASNLPLTDERLELLLELARQGDQDALNELFADQRRLLRSVAENEFRPFISHSALIQDALFAAFQKLASLRSVTAPVFRQWLLQILRRRMYRESKLRNRQRAQSADTAPSADLLVDDSPPPDANVQSADQRALIGKLIKSLTTSQQQIVHLRFFEGLSNSQIAVELNLTVESVEGHLKRSKAKLRGMLPESER